MYSKFKSVRCLARPCTGKAAITFVTPAVVPLLGVTCRDIRASSFNSRNLPNGIYNLLIASAGENGGVGPGLSSGASGAIIAFGHVFLGPGGSFIVEYSTGSNGNVNVVFGAVGFPPPYTGSVTLTPAKFPTSPGVPPVPGAVQDFTQSGRRPPGVIIDTSSGMVPEGPNGADTPTPSPPFSGQSAGIGGAHGSFASPNGGNGTGVGSGGGATFIGASPGLGAPAGYFYCTV